MGGVWVWVWVRGCVYVRVADTTAIVGNRRVYACMGVGVCVDVGAGVVADVCAYVRKILLGMKG